MKAWIAAIAAAMAMSTVDAAEPLEGVEGSITVFCAVTQPLRDYLSLNGATMVVQSMADDHSYQFYAGQDKRMIVVVALPSGMSCILSDGTMIGGLNG